MAIFVKWKKSIDADFRADYAALVGEGVVDGPIESETHYMLSSLKATEQHLSELVDIFGDDLEFSQDLPEWWVE